MDKIIRELNTLKNISPDVSFARMSKAAILSTERDSVRRFLPSWMKGAVANASVLALFVFVVVAINALQKPNIASTVSSINDIEKEAAIARNDIDITMEDINSFGESAAKTSLALNEVSSTVPDHLNTSLLKKEMNELKVDSDFSGSINTLLEEAASESTNE
mgnify:CR=1 FL=1